MNRAKILVVDDSAVARKMLSTVLAPHYAKVITASDVAEGKEQLHEDARVQILLADVILPDGDGFDLLQHARALDQVPKPRVVLMTISPKPDDELRALEMGATGYLTKPVSLGDLQRALSTHRIAKNTRKLERTRLLGRAVLRDPTRDERPVVHWDVRDISLGGAFLETTAPVLEGTELDLVLFLAGYTVRARAMVVRTQQPSWASAGGVGVYFTELPDSSREQLERFLTMMKAGAMAGRPTR